jgi:hypothetical protein
MAEVDPKDILSEYRCCARRSAVSYLLLGAGSVFASMIFLIDPARHCVEGPCPLWLRAAGSGLGLLFALGGANALWRNWQWGSRVENDTLVWWHGPAPAGEQRIPISQIKTLRYSSWSDSDDLHFLDEAGKQIPLPRDCLPSPLETWAEAFIARFPQVTLSKG